MTYNKCISLFSPNLKNIVLYLMFALVNHYKINCFYHKPVIFSYIYNFTICYFDIVFGINI